MAKVFRKDRKHCGKRRNCSLQAMSPFPTVFSTDLYCRHVKTRACLGKGQWTLFFFFEDVHLILNSLLNDRLSDMSKLKALTLYQMTDIWT